MSVTAISSASTNVNSAIRPTAFRSSAASARKAGPLRVAESTSVFCDDYLELVKERAYAGDGSATRSLREAIDVLLRLLAPVLPFATEEVWRWTHDGSIHVAPWPERRGADAALGLLPAVSAALIGIRRAKTDAKASQKTEVLSATLTGPAFLAEAADDLKAVGRIAQLTFVEADEIAVTDIVLAEATVE